MDTFVVLLLLAIVLKEIKGTQNVAISSSYLHVCASEEIFLLRSAPIARRFYYFHFIHFAQVRAQCADCQI